MADGVFTFRPEFKEFLPSYRYVNRVWIGDGVNTGTSGMLYAEYEDGSVAELGSVSLYATAVENGYQGTEKQWVQMIIGVADLVKGATAEIHYMISDSGVEHPDEESEEWSETPSFEQGKFTWAKVDLRWIDGTTTTFYSASYHGRDGSVTSVNAQTGDIVLHGENIPIAGEGDQTIKEYIDQSVIPEIATPADIESLFTMVFFSGAIFVSGRKFVEGDYVRLQIEAVTPGAPMPEETTITVSPTDGYSWRYNFGPLSYFPADLDGQERKTFEYRITEIENGIPGTEISDAVHTTSMTLIAYEDGTMRIEKATNWNALHFSHEYTASGHVQFSGVMTLNGRSMLAHEFSIEMLENGVVIYPDISTTVEVESGEAANIVYPTIFYTLEDIGVHTYTIRQTNPSQNGVTISDVVHIVTVTVTDRIRDGELEIITSENAEHLDYVNTYQSSGSTVFQGTTKILNRKFVSKDTYQLSVTGSGMLPSPAVLDVVLPAGETSVDFAFNALTYTLEDMKDAQQNYLPTKTFVYEVSETSLLPGTSDDELAHTITVVVTDDRKGHLVINQTYSDGAKLLFTDTYDASGSITIRGTKTLQNRKFVAGDRMTATLSTLNSARLPINTTIPVDLTIGQYAVDFAFEQITYLLSDLAGEETKTFSYVVTEITTIPGATNDAGYHTVDIEVTDNWDGTFTIVPTYVDGEKVEFLSIYDATGYLNITGTKTLVNRKFGSSDSMSVELTTSDGGNLPVTTVVPVVLSSSQNTADFSFNRITYKVQDLGGADSKTVHYAVTETCTMPGATSENLTDSFSVTITDMKDGTLSIVPTYTRDNKVTFTNVYSAEGTLTFKAKVVFTNGDMATNPFSVRVTQVTGNNSTEQATANVVLASPTLLIANAGAEQTLAFTDIVTFEKNSLKDDTGKTYWFMMEEITPTLDPNRMNNNIQYDTTRKWISVTATDNGLGQLIVAKQPAADSITDLDITFTNEQYCDLSVVALWTGDSDLLTTAQKNQATFILNGPNSFSQTFTYAEMTGGSKLFEHLHLGSYALTESNAEYDGFVNTITYTVGGNETNIVELTDGTAKTITADNSIDQLEGDLMIMRGWSGDTGLLPDSYKDSITYTVTGPNGYQAVLHGSDFSNDVYTLYQLTPGDYTIVASDTALENYDVSTGYVVGVNASNIAHLTYHGESIQITHSYNKLEASLTISETWAGDHFRLSQAQKNSIQYVVTGPKQVSTDEEAYRYVFTSADMTNGALTLSALTLGTYTVIETPAEIENFNITQSYNNGLITSNSVVLNDADSKTITVNNNVNKLEASLTIAHAWGGDYIRLTAEQRNGLTFTVTGPKQLSTDAEAYRQVFTLADMANGTKTFDRLTLGEYAVVVSNNVFENFTVTETYRVNMNEINHTTLEDGDSKTITVITDVNKLEGSLTITKVWTGDHARLTKTQKNAFTYTVTGPKQWETDAATYSQTFTYADMTNGSMLLERLTLGTYTVTETNNAVENFSIATTYSVNGSATNSVEIADGDSKTVTVTNDVNKLEGSLTITKTWTGDFATLTNEQRNGVTFTVTGPQQHSSDPDIYRNVFTYADMDNGSMTLNQLTPGTYTVVETNNAFENYIVTTTYSASDGGTSSTVVADGETRTITVNNAVNKQEAGLTITKSWTGDHALLTQQQKNGVTFTVTGPKQISTDADAFSATFAYSDMVNDTKTFEHLTLGTYTVTEINNTFNRFDTTVIYTENGTQTGSALLRDGDSKTINVENSIAEHKGSIKVTKLFDGITEIPVTFSISNDYDSTVFTLSNADNAGTADGLTVPYEWTIDNIPEGTVVTFTEAGYDVAGYLLKAISPTTKTSNPVAHNTTITLGFINSYERKTGTVKVTKTFDGIMDIPDNFGISNDYNSAVFTPLNSDNAEEADGAVVPYEWTIENVPEGTEITFTEINYEAAGYILTSQTSDTSDPVVYNSTVTVDFVNSYEREEP